MFSMIAAISWTIIKAERRLKRVSFVSYAFAFKTEQSGGLSELGVRHMVFLLGGVLAVADAFAMLCFLSCC